ncbi:MAG: Spy/CpxP family protein refolding chaperone [Desulfatibacillaceae bacterium]
MLKWTMIGVLAVLLLVSVAPANAGDGVPSGKWWRNPKVVEEINITPQEQEKLDESFLQFQRDSIDVKSRLEKERLELDHLMSRKSIDEKEAKAAMSEVDKARSELADRRFEFLLEVRNILGNERFNELKDKFREYRKNRRGERRR